MPAFAVTATRRQGEWAVRANVSDVDVWTHCRRLDQVPAVARKAIAVTLDRPDDDVEVTVTSVVEMKLQSLLDGANALAALADDAQRASTLLNVETARTLRSHGLSVRDTGALMSLSSQRISQLVPGAVTGPAPHTDALDDLITTLEHMQLRIEVALSTLRPIAAEHPPAQSPPSLREVLTGPRGRLLLRRRRQVLKEVTSVGLANPRVFGSVARGEDDTGSDIDLLVDLGPDRDVLALNELHDRLLPILGPGIDVTTPAIMRPPIRAAALGEALPL